MVLGAPRIISKELLKSTTIPPSKPNPKEIEIKTEWQCFTTSPLQNLKIKYLCFSKKTSNFIEPRYRPNRHDGRQTKNYRGRQCRYPCQLNRQASVLYLSLLPLLRVLYNSFSYPYSSVFYFTNTLLPFTMQMPGAVIASTRRPARSQITSCALSRSTSSMPVVPGKRTTTLLPPVGIAR